MKKLSLFLCFLLFFPVSTARSAGIVKKNASVIKKETKTVLPEITPVPFTAPEVREVVSPSGVKAWLIEEKNTPVIAVSVLFKGGRSADPDRLTGLSDVVAALSNEGAGALDGVAFQEILSENGIYMNFSAAQDYFAANFQTLRETKETAFDLFMQALTNPRFDRKAVRRVKQQFSTALDAKKGNPSALAQERFFKLMFKGHPYARPNVSKSGLNEITRANLTRYTRERFAKNNMLIGVSGNISAEELSALLEEFFTDFPDKAVLKTVPETKPLRTSGIDVLSTDVMQSAVMFGHKGIARNDDDFYAAYLAMHIFGNGGFSSRLFEEIREKQGLTYGISAFLSPLKASPLIIGGAAADNAKMAQLINGVKNEWQKAAQKGFSEEEMNDAKTYLKGSFALAFSSSEGLADFLAAMQYNDLGIDYLNNRNALFEAVSLERLNKTAERIFIPDNLFFVVIGKPANL